MHIVLTDVLTCPRCGPEFGLIVLADQMIDRSVQSGRLGCANCREEYPVEGGVADLRFAPPEPGVALAPLDPDRALRFAALLGVGHGQGTVLAYGAAPGLVAAIQDHLPNALVVGIGPEAPAGGAADTGWVAVSGALPVRDGAIRGLLAATPTPAWFAAEAARVLARGAHLVLDPAEPAAAAGLQALGMQLLLEQDGVAVASNTRAG